MSSNTAEELLANAHVADEPKLRIDKSTLVKKRLARERLKISNQLKGELAAERAEAENDRPKTRADCKNIVGPCPFVACRYHLAIDEKDTGAIQLNFPNRDPNEELLPEVDFSRIRTTCALDVADEGEKTLEEVAAFLGVTREMVRLIQNGALKKLGIDLTLLELKDGP